ncbi:mannitol 1-phosphate dehydrogenase 2 [Xylariomycetidae sp. FL2044]|nr:mannitol 1-phosphate dehydrogenase 2 [Xylariomycetidae sp. FL2044]
MTTSSSPSTTRPFDLAIVGGGITGLILAIGLLKHGIPLTIYESAASFGEIGAGVGFGPNAVRALALVSPQVQDAYEKCVTHQWESKQHVWFTVRVGDQQRRAGATAQDEGRKLGDGAFEVVYKHDGTRGGVHRANFLEHLVKLIPESVTRFGKRLVDIENVDGEEEATMLRFADGTTAVHSAVLGCDGIKSRTREILLGRDEARPVFSGKYRGLIPMDEAVAMLGAEQAQNSQMYVGYHGHIITFPIQKGKTMNVVAFGSRDEWTDPEWVVKASKEQMLSDFGTWGPTATSIIGAMRNPDVWALFNHRPARTYYGRRPRICLVGDAAHASTPHQGSGAGMCVEDCYILSNLLAKAEALGDLDEAFRVFDEVRRPRTQRLVETSREAARLYQFELLGDDPEAIRRDMQDRMDWIWYHDIEAELERAEAMLAASL